MAFSKNIILFISANVCVIYCLLGQSPGLHGYIYDKETSEPLIGASILLEGTSFGSATDITETTTFQVFLWVLIIYRYLI
ncbi:MAG: hypothetical protein IPJ39_16755 [Saprospiraceae bacterium]|nr:hypothetical protein [Saprospiraceae bacterium]